jgi:hypothetical protein
LTLAHFGEHFLRIGEAVLLSQLLAEMGCFARLPESLFLRLTASGCTKIFPRFALFTMDVAVTQEWLTPVAPNV